MHTKDDKQAVRFRSYKNILRLAISADGRAHRSVMVTDKALARFSEGTGGFGVTEENGARDIAFGGRTLLQLAGWEMAEKDVIRYTTNGEPPEVEVVKTVDGQRTRIKNLAAHVDRAAYAGSVSFRLGESEGVYGFGQDEEGGYNRRGQKLYLYQHNMRIPMPCFVSDGGYGVIFDCASLMIFDDTGGETKVHLDTVDEIVFYIIAGTPDEIIAGFRQLTGRASMLPKWAFGYIQSKERYQTADELVDMARRCRELNIPLDCAVQDWKTWEGDGWGQKTVDRARYPDLIDMKRRLKELNVHTLVSVWPNMAEGTPDHAEFAREGLLLGDYSTYDAFSEKGRALYFKQAKELYEGFDGWWCDSTEPFTSPDWCGETLLPEEERYELVGGEHKKYLDPAYANFYAVEHAKGVYEHEREAGERRVINLTRSGYSGIQRYGAVLWAGDTSARWENLKGEIAKGLSVSMCGAPYWTVDIGAFFVGGTACWRKWSGNPTAAPVWFWNGEYDEGVSNMGYRELYVRWLQFGCFLPLFRSHGTDTPREIWHFGEKGTPFYDAIEKFIRLRYRLLPYIYSLAASAALEDKTMLRSLMFDFPGDEKAKNISHQFMLGEALMICPVTEPMYYDKDGEALARPKKRACYLPEGASWIDFWTNEAYAGGRTIEANAELDKIPVFVRAGSIVPMQRNVSHALENRSEFEIRIYPGADARFAFYDDDGLTYDYENGAYERVELNWDNAARRLHLTETSRFREGAITFNVRLGEECRTAIFEGGEQTVCF